MSETHELTVLQVVYRDEWDIAENGDGGLVARMRRNAIEAMELRGEIVGELDYEATFQKKVDGAWEPPMLFDGEPLPNLPELVFVKFIGNVIPNDLGLKELARG